MFIKRNEEREQQSLDYLEYPGLETWVLVQGLPAAGLNTLGFIFPICNRKGLTKRFPKSLPGSEILHLFCQKVFIFFPSTFIFNPYTEAHRREFTAIHNSHRHCEDIQSWDLRNTETPNGQREDSGRGKKTEGRKGRRSHRHMYVPLSSLSAIGQTYLWPTGAV